MNGPGQSPARLTRGSGLHPSRERVSDWPQTGRSRANASDGEGSALPGGIEEGDAMRLADYGTAAKRTGNDSGSSPGCRSCSRTIRPNPLQTDRRSLELSLLWISDAAAGKDPRFEDNS